MGKKIAILVANMYEDLELWYPYYRLKEAGHETVTVGFEKGQTYNSKHSYPCTAEAGIADVTPEEFDGVICPGGFCPDYLRRDERIVKFVRDLHNAGKPVAAICHGAWMFCSAHILDGKRATCFKAIIDDVVNAGAKFEDSSVVVDGNMITSRVPSDLPDFCRAILAML